MPKKLLTISLFLLCAFCLKAQPQIQDKIWCICQVKDVSGDKKTTTETLVLNSSVSPHPYSWGSHYGTYIFSGINELSLRENGTGTTRVFYTNVFDNGNYLTLVESSLPGNKTTYHFVLCSPQLK